MIHILRAPKTTTDKEKAQLESLDKYQKKYLSNRCCGACEKPLDQVGCGSFYEACPEQTRIERRSNCLEQYKPRPNVRKNKKCREKY
jgi:hypothetical protein